MNRLLLILPLLMVGCATRPLTYQPPSSAKLNASTQRLSQSVAAAHVSAKKAQASVNQASQRAKQAQTDVAKLKDVPPLVTQELNDLQTQLADATQAQTELENHLKEADQAKAQVEADKKAYYDDATQLAQKATDERNSRIADESKLHWYRMHWWGSWIVLGLGILACVVLSVLKFTGKLLL